MGGHSAPLTLGEDSAGRGPRHLCGNVAGEPSGSAAPASEPLPQPCLALPSAWQKLRSCLWLWALSAASRSPPPWVAAARSPLEAEALSDFVSFSQKSRTDLAFERELKASAGLPAGPSPASCELRGQRSAPGAPEQGGRCSDLPVA